MKAYQLSLPGPTECDPVVVQAMVRPNIPHYGEIWIDLYNEIIEKLRKVYLTEGKIFVIPCSGSGGIEAVFCSIGKRRGIVLNNGTFGMRMVEIARRHLGELRVIENNIGQPFETGQVEQLLKEKHFDLLAVVHGETSTGMVNHLGDLAGFCHRNNMLFVVDAISTLGGVPLDVDSLGIDFCVSASQKALGAIAGLATVAVSERGWKALPEECTTRAWYLNLKTWARYEKEWMDWHPYPVTLPTHLFFALNKALELILEEGLEKRWKRHECVSLKLQEDLICLGVTLLISEHSNRLATTTAAMLPEGYSSEELQHYLQENHGILIAGGVGPLRKRIFRIGHMGYSAQQWLVNRVVAGIREFVCLQPPADVASFHMNRPHHRDVGH